MKHDRKAFSTFTSILALPGWMGATSFAVVHAMPWEVRNEEINKILRTYVDNKTVHWLDLGHEFLDDQGTLKTELMPDDLHPNLDGYRAWAEAMEPTISQFLGDSKKEMEKPLVFNPVPQPEKPGKHDIPNPDFTKGDKLPENAVHDLMCCLGWLAPPLIMIRGRKRPN